MNLFLHEYFYFVSSIIAILVCVSAASLFFLAVQYEKKLKSSKRALGFSILALAYLLGILERRFLNFGIAGNILEVIGLAFICFGVIAEPLLSHLSHVEEREATQKKLPIERKDVLELLVSILLVIFLAMLVSTLNIKSFGQANLEEYLRSALHVISLIFILVTIIYQIKRYIKYRTMQNLLPLLGYIFLLCRAFVLILYRLPELDIVTLRLFTLNFSTVWRIAYIMAIVAFAFLGVWAWNFIKVRFFLRVYVVFLAIGIIMASLGSLIVLLLNFRIIENNNLQKLDDHAEAIDVVMEEKLGTSNFIARLISENEQLLKIARSDDVEALETKTKEFLEDAELDIVRVYDDFGVIVASPHDPRDIGRSFSDDELVRYVLDNRKEISSYSYEPGVLSPNIVARSLYPTYNENSLSGVVEVGYKFDTPFVDFLSRETTFDISIFTNDERSATTLTTEDGISRWVGSKETNEEVVKQVLKDAEKYQGITEGLDHLYYSAYSPITNHMGEVIGMISAESSTYQLFEDTREQLVMSFLLVGTVSLIPTLVGYLAIRSYNFNKKFLNQSK